MSFPTFRRTVTVTGLLLWSKPGVDAEVYSRSGIRLLWQPQYLTLLSRRSSVRKCGLDSMNFCSSSPSQGPTCIFGLLCIRVEAVISACFLSGKPLPNHLIHSYIYLDTSSLFLTAAFVHGEAKVSAGTYPSREQYPHSADKIWTDVFRNMSWGWFNLPVYQNAHIRSA